MDTIVTLDEAIAFLRSLPLGKHLKHIIPVNANPLSYKSKIDEMNLWGLEQCEEPFSIVYQEDIPELRLLGWNAYTKISTGYRFYFGMFRNENDAVHFKMRFG